MKYPSKSLEISRHLRRIVKKAAVAESARLPSIRSLAKQFAVSEGTIVRSIRILDDEGLVSRVERDGIYAGHSLQQRIPANINVGTSQTKSEAVAEELADDISRGTYKAGRNLPMVKALQHRFGVSKPTILRALRFLEHRAMIRRRISGYVIGTGTPQQSGRTRNRVCLIGRPPQYQHRFRHADLHNFIPVFEQELQEYGTTSLEFVHPEKAPRLVASGDAEDIAGLLLVQGYLIGNAAQQQSQIKKILAPLYSADIPLIILNANMHKELYFGIRLMRHKNIFALWQDHYKVGRDVARFCAAHGHRNIAYFSYIDAHRNRSRRDGFVQGIEQATQGRAHVHLFESNTPPGQRGRIRHTIYEALRKALEPMPREPWGPEPHALAEKLRPTLNPAANTDFCKHTMRSLFDKALAQKRITAWVFDGELAACAGMEYLFEKGIHIPERLSAISAADTEALLDLGMTAYAYYQENAAYLAAHCIIGDIPIRRNRQGFVEYAGKIINRGSMRAL